MPKRTVWLGLTLLAGIAACQAADERDPDGALGSSGAASRGSPEAGNGDPPEGSGAAVAPMDTGAWVVDQPDGSAGPEPHPWVNGTAQGGGARSGAAMLVRVRTARQDGYDRVVFEFDSHVPAWRAEYVDRPQYECGSGEAVRVAGDGWLQVNLEPANAHTEEGRATEAPRHVTDPAGANLRELRRICDFEAQVQYVIGVASPNRFRAFQLTGPARLVVDIRH